MTRLYIYEEMEQFTDADLEQALGRVSAERRMKALEHIHTIDRKQSAVAELLLRYALRDAFGMEGLPGIAYGAAGKPALRGEGMPRFNLSHCKEAVACAVADEEVGVDVEPYASYGEDVAREVFNGEELAAATGCPDVFAELWTKKESYLKYTGQGLTDSLRTLLRHTGGAQFDTFHAVRGYACTVCSHAGNHGQPIFVAKTRLLNG